MGRQIVRQPNGLYAVWSSVVDNFVLLDATESEVVEELAANAVEQLRKDVRRIVAQLEIGQRPYHQFTKTFEECVAIIRDLHGEGDETLKLIAELEPR